MWHGLPSVTLGALAHGFFALPCPPEGIIIIGKVEQKTVYDFF
jgi:hypothetical protein